MPPKPKYERAAILSAALGIVKERGMGALTARELGSALSCSSQPVFTVFRNMEEVQSEVRTLAMALYATYVQRGLLEEKPFLGVGRQYILFAMQEPKLFQLLFMTERSDTFNVSEALPVIDENYEAILSAAMAQNALNRADAQRFYRHLWVYAHGLAALCATGVTRPSPQELDALFEDVSMALVMRIKAESERNNSQQPQNPTRGQRGAVRSQHSQNAW